MQLRAEYEVLCKHRQRPTYMKSPSLATAYHSGTYLQADRTPLTVGDPRTASRLKPRIAPSDSSQINHGRHRRRPTTQASRADGQTGGESELWAALLSSIWQSPLASAQAALDFVDEAAGRVQRLLGPPPRGFPPGIGPFLVRLL